MISLEIQSQVISFTCPLYFVSKSEKVIFLTTSVIGNTVVFLFCFVHSAGNLVPFKRFNNNFFSFVECFLMAGCISFSSFTLVTPKLLPPTFDFYKAGNPIVFITS